jgi:hypothetical protein
MIWILWAIMLLGHGAFVRWARTTRSYAKVSIFGDVLLIAIGLITLDQLQGLGLMEVLRTGIFFVAFGMAGSRLMASVLKQSA